MKRKINNYFITLVRIFDNYILLFGLLFYDSTSGLDFNTYFEHVKFIWDAILKFMELYRITTSILFLKFFIMIFYT